MKKSGSKKNSKYSIIISFMIIILGVFFFFVYAQFAFAHSLDTISLNDNVCLNKDSFTVMMDHPFGFRPLAYSIDNIDISTHARYSDGKAYLDLKDLREGEHTFTVRFGRTFDPFSLITDYRTIIFNVDTTPPDIVLDSPVNEIVKENEILLMGRTEANSTVIIDINGMIFQNATDNQGRFEQEIRLEKETNKLHIVVVDKAGNASALEKKLILDSLMPVIVVKSPLPKQVIKSNSKVISVEATDSGSGLKECYFEVDGARVTCVYNPKKNTLSTYLKDLDEGLYNLKVVATDYAGWKTEVSWSFIVDSREDIGNNNVRPGALGEDVLKIQKRLFKMNLLSKTSITGTYDDKTEQAVRQAQENLKLPVTGIIDTKTYKAISNRIHIYLNNFALYLISPYDRVLKKYSIACGSPYYPTPEGQYEVAEKTYHPTWYPPDSPWARGAKPIPPGPGNPLGTRWIGLNGNLVGIHGTPSPWSIGSPASHGCIRMYIRDAEELFDLVDIGTPVKIYKNFPMKHKKYKNKDRETKEPQA